MSVFEQLEQVLDLHFGECTCKSDVVLKLNMLEASRDISNVFLTMIQPLIIAEDEKIEHWKKTMRAIVAYLEEVDEKRRRGDLPDGK